MKNRLSVNLDCIIFGLQRFGGISNYWSRLVEHACVTPDVQWQLTQPKTVKFGGFDARWMTMFPVVQERLPTRVARYLSAPVGAGTEVFHTSYYRLPQRSVSRFVVTAYDFTYEKYGSGLARTVHSAQKLRSLRHADAVICISDSTKRDVLEFCGAIDARRVHVVPLGVDTSVYFPDVTTPPVAPVNRTVLFVGQRTDYKRFDLAIQAVRASNELILGIVGPPLTSGESNLLQQSLAGRWHAYGPVPATELRKLYSSAHAFIFPSDYEGFGLPVLEAMACGCPVVASNSSSLPEVGGPAALYASEQSGDAYAALLSRLDEPRERTLLVEAGLHRVLAFPWLRTIEQTMMIYRGM